MNAKLSRYVADLRYTVGALYVSLVNLEGQALVENGDVGAVDKNLLNQLLSGSVKRSRQLALAFEEPRALDLHYYGERYEIFCRQVADSTFLALVIDRESSTVRMGGVLLYLKRAIETIRQELGTEESQAAPDLLAPERASVRSFDRRKGFERAAPVPTDGPIYGNGESERPVPPTRESGSAPAVEQSSESNPPPIPPPPTPEESAGDPEDESLILEEESLDPDADEEIGPRAAPGGETFDLEEAIRRGLVPPEIAGRLGPQGRGEA